MNKVEKDIFFKKVLLICFFVFSCWQNVDAKNKNETRTSVLVCSSWQSINMGDVAHTPGLIEMFNKYLPEVEVRVWVSNVENGAEEMLQKHFPTVQIIKRSDSLALKRAFIECSFLLHGSGPWLVVKNDIKQWMRESGKPYGVMGISLPENHATPDVVELLDNAKFVYFRDTVSLELAKSKSVKAPLMKFGPDVAFASSILNNKASNKFMKENGLKKGKFLCVIPKLRKTPHWLVPDYNAPYEPKVDSLNQAMKEHDLKPYRDAIIAVVRQTKAKVLICAEDVTQVALGKEMLYDPLPEDVKRYVVWRNRFWLPDEALSIYKKSAGYFGLEQHSPIICIGNRIPALLGRTKDQTSKGYMWLNIGLKDWFFDSDVSSDMDRLTQSVLSLIKNPKVAQKTAKAAQQRVKTLQQEMMDVLRDALNYCD